MMPAVTQMDYQFPQIREQVGPVAGDSSPSTGEEPPPTRCAVETQAATELAAPAEVKGWPSLPGYEILGELGCGGMALVYKARDLHQQRTVAIKVCDLSLAGQGEIVARFHQEQLLAIRLTHPNLVAAYDAGHVAGVPYLVLELVEGQDLACLVQERGALSLIHI